MIAKAVVGHYLYKIKTGDKSSPEDLSPLKNSN